MSKYVQKNRKQNQIKSSKVNGVKPIASKSVTVKGQDTPIKETNEPGLLTKYINSRKKLKSNNQIIPVKPVVEKESEKEIQSLQDLMLAQLAEFKTAPVSTEEYNKPVTFVTASNGVFRVVKTKVALFKTLHREFDEKIAGIPEMEEGVELLVPKIPFKHIIKALTFFKDVYELDKTESSLLFFWNEDNKPLPTTNGVLDKGFYVEGKLVIYCPDQENQYTLTNFEGDTIVPWLRNNLSLLLELHSHADFDAFFSGTDDANENMNQFYGVWGRVNEINPMFAFRWVSGDAKIECSPDILIEWPKVVYTERTQSYTTSTISVEDNNGLLDITLADLEPIEMTQPDKIVKLEELAKGPFVEVEYPDAWLLEKHKKYVYQYAHNVQAKNMAYSYDYPYNDYPYYGYGTTYDDVYYDDYYYDKQNRDYSKYKDSYTSYYKKNKERVKTESRFYKKG